MPSPCCSGKESRIQADDPFWNCFPAQHSQTETSTHNAALWCRQNLSQALYIFTFCHSHGFSFIFTFPLLPYLIPSTVKWKSSSKSSELFSSFLVLIRMKSSESQVSVSNTCTLDSKWVSSFCHMFRLCSYSCTASMAVGFHTTKFKIPLITRNFTTALILVSVISFMNHFNRTLPVGQPAKANSTVTSQATIRDDDKTSECKSFPSFYLLIIMNKPRTGSLFLTPSHFYSMVEMLLGTRLRVLSFSEFPLL